MSKYIALITIVLFLCPFNIWAEETEVLNTNDTIPEGISKPRSIFEILNENDTTQNAVFIHQDKRIEQLFHDRQLLNNGGQINGYRVQVFSSNMQQTAKSEAFRIKALVEEKFPGKGVYESYSSPFWKVRVGDARTRAEAQVLLTELMKAFPNMKMEMYIVPDKINVGGVR